MCFDYLSKYKPILDKRASDAGAQWFEYGRRQGLNTVEKKKLILSTVITNRVHVYEIDCSTVVYAGITITCEDDKSLAKAREILESPDFFKYVNKIGTNVSGSSIRITAKDVNSFCY